MHEKEKTAKRPEVPKAKLEKAKKGKKEKSQDRNIGIGAKRNSSKVSEPKKSNATDNSELEALKA